MAVKFRTVAVLAMAVFLLVATGSAMVWMQQKPEPTTALWGLCCSLTLSGLCAGLTTGLLCLSRGELEAEASRGNSDAQAVLSLRQDTNGLVVTLITANVFFTLATDGFVEGALVGKFAWLKIPVSMGLIVYLAEVLPVAFLTRYGLKVGGLLTPAIQLLRVIFWPIAKPGAYALDKALGKESLEALAEHTVTWLLQRQPHLPGAEITHLEAIGAANFLRADDTLVVDEGEEVDPVTIIKIPIQDGKPNFVYDPTSTESQIFVSHLGKTSKSWAVLTNANGEPVWLLDVDGFMRRICIQGKNVPISAFSHKPIMITDKEATLEDVIRGFRVKPEHAEDDVIDDDVALVNIPDRPLRIITGADILGRLLRGIVTHETAESVKV